MDIIEKLKNSNLTGRSGSDFPTGLKWEMVKNAQAEKKYIICNASEGEPSVFKDGFILKNYPEEIINGIKIALETIDNSSAYIYLRKDYYEKFKDKLKKLSKNLPVKLFKKRGGYLAGEETVACQVIEGKRPEPRLKPPYPTEKGLFDFPTLINNLETFYSVSKIAKGQYENKRFYSLSGDLKKPGVFELSEDWSIEKILRETSNYPNFDFFVKAGGGAVGEILLPYELKQKVAGQGAIIVFNKKKTNLISLMKEWAEFFQKENCDKCVPCREGIFRINQMLKTRKVDKKLIEDLVFILEETSFCGLGKGAALSFKSLINKLYD